MTPANVGAHFLPYDAGNFLFSSQPGLTKDAQQEAIYHLNQNALYTNVTPAAGELIAGWYPNGTHTFYENYLPTSWQGQGQLAADFYHKVVGPACRGCHINLTEPFNLEDYTIVTDENQDSRAYDSRILRSMGRCDTVNPLFRAHSMPNSAVTFNQFWKTAGTANDLPKLVEDFLSSLAILAGGAPVDPLDLTCQPSSPF